MRKPSITVHLSEASLRAIEKLLSLGVFGDSRSDVCVRLIDEGLIRLSDFRPLKLKNGAA